MYDMLNLTSIDINVEPLTQSYEITKIGSWKWEQKNRKNNAIILIEKGQCEYTVNNENYLLSKGDMLILLEGDEYIGKSLKDDDSSCTFHVISFDIVSGDLFYTSRVNNVNHYEKMLSLFKEMALCMQNSKFGYKIKGKKIIYEILYNLYKEMFYNEILNETQINIDNARNYIDTHYNQKITVEMLANVSGYCRSYFKKLFKQQYNISSSDYLNYVRIEKAKSLIEEKSYSISQIAMIVGYSSESYFSQVFKKKVGCSPKDY